MSEKKGNSNVICTDVGSNSVRVAIINVNAANICRVLCTTTKEITVYNRKPLYYEQKTSEIWDAQCLQSVHLDFRTIDAIAFTATCSLVIVEESSNLNDVIMWMDHRAIREAERITESDCKILNNFGTICSPEFSISKMLWLQNNHRERFAEAIAFFELPDWLCWRATRTNATTCDQFPRSVCCTTCKWGFDSESGQWPNDIFSILNGDYADDIKRRIGEKSALPGTFISNLSEEAAIEMGLVSPLLRDNYKENSSIAVASSLIDAHSGVLAMISLFLSTRKEKKENDPLESIMCMIAGTSTCHMVLNKQRTLTIGVWGPYYDVIFPDYYLREAGQSAVGKLLEFLVTSHPDYETIYKNCSFDAVIKALNKIVSAKRNSRQMNSLHVIPSFHGNRSPFANPTLKVSEFSQYKLPSIL
ncbi:FGGY carbohydrate kinase domain-containing-like protein [Dinothrombium tinctorium]|uniref:FGGY carbohydrate kinase domain-containing-like protein n=1 Tax=Dinothrombium tinctorium TaxID=1965070 RepID=A0A443RNT4_9ACAR|nr:FGGY carbohydrate kinase domain-containing-like protein [Dinothrombium tinctorium]